MKTYLIHNDKKFEPLKSKSTYDMPHFNEEEVEKGNKESSDSRISDITIDMEELKEGGTLKQRRKVQTDTLADGSNKQSIQVNYKLE